MDSSTATTACVTKRAPHLEQIVCAKQVVSNAARRHPTVNVRATLDHMEWTVESPVRTSTSIVEREDTRQWSAKIPIYNSCETGVHYFATSARQGIHAAVAAAAVVMTVAQSTMLTLRSQRNQLPNPLMQPQHQAQPQRSMVHMNYSMIFTPDASNWHSATSYFNTCSLTQRNIV